MCTIQNKQKNSFNHTINENKKQLSISHSCASVQIKVPNILPGGGELIFSGSCLPQLRDSPYGSWQRPPPCSHMCSCECQSIDGARKTGSRTGSQNLRRAKQKQKGMWYENRGRQRRKKLNKTKKILKRRKNCNKTLADKFPQKAHLSVQHACDT